MKTVIHVAPPVGTDQQSSGSPSDVRIDFTQQSAGPGDNQPWPAGPKGKFPHAAETGLPAGIVPALRSALRRAEGWPVPRNWSSRDWFEELDQVGIEAASEAVRDYEPDSVFPVEAFVHNHVLGKVRTCYRREWAFAVRFCNARPQDGDEESEEVGSKPSTPRELFEAPSPVQDELSEAVKELEDGDRWVITQIFWNGCTEGELARDLKLSQRAVSKRKQAALKHLHERLGLPGVDGLAKSPEKKSKQRF